MRENLTKKELHKDYVIHNYVELHKSTVTISKELDISKSTVLNILKENNIKRRSFSESKRTYTIDENYFSIIDTDEKAYYLGFIYGDGCNYPEKNLLNIVSGKDDYNHLQKMLHIVSPNKNVKLLLSKSKTEIVSLEIWNKKISKDLIKLGAVKAKTKIIKFPEFLKPILFKSFIRGIFDADGCFSYYNIKSHNKYDCTICEFSISSTKNVCDGINKILNQQVGIPIRNLKIDKRIFSGSAIYKNSNPKELVLIYNYLYKDSTIHLERKKVKFEEFFNIRNIKYD